MVWTDPGSLSAVSVARTQAGGKHAGLLPAGPRHRLAACSCLRRCHFCWSTSDVGAGTVPGSAEGEVRRLQTAGPRSRSPRPACHASAMPASSGRYASKRSGSMSLPHPDPDERVRQWRRRRLSHADTDEPGGPRRSMPGFHLDPGLRPAAAAACPAWPAALKRHPWLTCSHNHRRQAGRDVKRDPDALSARQPPVPQAGHFRSGMHRHDQQSRRVTVSTLDPGSRDGSACGGLRGPAPSLTNSTARTQASARPVPVMKSRSKGPDTYARSASPGRSSR